MPTTSSYRPYRTTERSSASDDSFCTNHRNALFDPLRFESAEARAEALSRIESKLLLWSHLAYPEAEGREEVSSDLGNSRFIPSLTKEISGEGVFELEHETDIWYNEEISTTSKFSSSLSLVTDDRSPPSNDSAFDVSPQRLEDGDHSVFDASDASFPANRSTNELKEILKSCLLTVLRASVDCPFEDVRRYSRYILHRVFMVGANVPDLICKGPSWLIPVVETIAFAYDKRPQPVQAEDPDANVTGSHEDSWKETTLASCASSPVSRTMKIGKSGNGDATTDELIYGRSEMSTHMDDVVFESDDDRDYHVKIEKEAHGATDALTAVSAIPISSKKATRTPIDPSDIDDILLGPVGIGNRDRKARFNQDATSLKTEQRPSLGRKRSSSSTHSMLQRRANHNLRIFHLNCYLSTGRISNLGRILSYFPRFYESTIVLHDELIRKQGGPLKRSIKLYLSILAAAQAKCQYLVSYFSKKFMQLGLSREWLDGLHRAPRRIQRLSLIIAILANQPWRIRKVHIEELLGRSKESCMRGDSSDQWTMGELVQAISILIVVNCQAHFCLAVGVVPEPDTFGGACIRQRQDEKAASDAPLDIYPLFTSFDSRAFASPASVAQTKNGFSKAAAREQVPCMIVPGKGSLSTSQAPTPTESEEEETIPSLLWKRRQSFNHNKLWSPSRVVSNVEEEFDVCSTFAQCGLSDEFKGDTRTSPLLHTSSYWAAANLIHRSPGTDGLLDPFQLNAHFVDDEPETATMPVNPILEDMSRFYDPVHQICPEEFDLQSRDYAVLRLVDCNWEDHTCPLIGRFVPNLETVLDQNLAEARLAAGDDDDGFFFTSDEGTIDQGPLRDAVWFFVLRLYGIYNDGYDYSDVNLLLNKSAKRFLKKVCVRPDQINRQDWRSIGRGLKNQERVLLALLATHARMYACLVYAFRYCQ